MHVKIFNYLHFTREEMQCHCTECDDVPPDEFMQALERVRVECGFPFTITSGFRCPNYNNRVSNSGYDGPHTRGAADIGIYGERALRIIEVARRHGFTGFGVKQNGPRSGRFIHIDRIPRGTSGFIRPHIWSDY